MKKADIKFVCDRKGSRFEIDGPPELLFEIGLVYRVEPKNEVETLERNHKLDNVLSKWYVNCAVTNEQIDLSCLLYWDVDKQIAFKDCATAVKWAQENRITPEKLT